MKFFRDLEKKWQKIWEETKIFEPEIDKNKEKYFITVPYPYMSGLLHLGSAYTFSRGEFIARYKRLKGYNVLWPQGWHITGAPIVGKALRLREGDPKVIKELRDAGIPEEEWDKLKTPEGWAMKFIELNKEAFKRFGFSIDWRREFYTTYLNPWYNKFVQWQYKELKKKGLISKGSHPVVWDSKVNKVIGDHDRPDEYAGISPIEGYIIKFKLEDRDLIHKIYVSILTDTESEIDISLLELIHKLEDKIKNKEVDIDNAINIIKEKIKDETVIRKLKTLFEFIQSFPEFIIIPCFTLRPETVYGVTNIWINPEAKYALYKVNNELWILPKTIVIEELKAQDFDVEYIEDIDVEELLGKYVINPATNEKVPILPAKFVDSEIGTGIVMSVPAHAPYDYIALKDLVMEFIDVDGIKIERKAYEILKNIREAWIYVFWTIKKNNNVLKDLESYFYTNDIFKDLREKLDTKVIYHAESVLVEKNKEIIVVIGKYNKEFRDDRIIGLFEDKDKLAAFSSIEVFNNIFYKKVRYKLEFSEIAKKCLENMKSLFKLEGFSEFPAKDIVERMQIKSQEDKEKLEKATQEIYSKEYYNGILKDIFGKYAGKRIHEIKEEFEKELVEKGIAIKYYTLPIRFKSRYGGVCIVKIVKNQWFLRYSDPEWKKLAHECIDSMSFYPEEIRNLLHQMVDWYKDWACAHQKELGTPLPWDPEWTLESLSDSTIYMAYYTIAHLIKKIPPEKIEDDLFDYVFLGKGEEKKLIEKYGEVIKRMREEFLYWYPVDLRTSAKDLIQNHFVFYIFHHVAIFPKEFWPRRIVVNGWVLMEGKKMSKSLGNYIAMLDAARKYPIDVLRFLLAYAGNSGFDDANIEINKWKEILKGLYNWYEFAIRNYGRGREEKLLIDEWFENVLYKTVKDVESEYENMNYKNVLVKGFYELQNKFKWYMKRVNVPNKNVLNKFIEIQTLILYPIVPHIASEILEKVKGKKFALNPKWPEIKEVDEEKIKTEEYIMKIREDIIRIKNITKKEKIDTIKIIVASNRKYEIFGYAKEILKEYMLKDLTRKLVEKFGKDVIPIAQRIFRDPGLLESYINRNLEIEALKEAKEFLEKEFNAKVIIETEEESKEEKAKQALPGKPAIILN